MEKGVLDIMGLLAAPTHRADGATMSSVERWDAMTEDQKAALKAHRSPLRDPPPMFAAGWKLVTDL